MIRGSDFRPDAPGEASRFFRKRHFNHAEKKTLTGIEGGKVLVELPRGIAANIIELPKAVRKLHLNVSAEFIIQLHIFVNFNVFQIARLHAASPF